MYCKHCNQYVPSYATSHECPKNGLLEVDRDDSFLVSTAIGAVTDSALLGGLLGGNLLGGMVGDVLDGDLFD